MRRFFLFAAGALLATTSLAHADLMITPGGGSTGDVIQFEAQYNNLPSFNGDTNQNGGSGIATFLNLNSTGTGYGPELLGTDGNGQADVVCTASCGTDSQGGLNGMLITGVEIKLDAPLAATQEIFNLDYGVGTVAIVAQDNFGNTFDYLLGQGENFFTITALPGTGEFITDTKIFSDVAANGTGPFGFNDLKQPRITACLLGSTCNTVSQVPEPTTLALFGGALLGLAFLHRRKRFTRLNGEKTS